ncbi:MAG: glycoside hydrolase family 88 protein, partial [Verrucomicrobiales bacterium]
MRFSIVLIFLLSASVLAAPAQDLPGADTDAQETTDAALLTPPDSSDPVPLAPVETVDFPLGMDARWRMITARLHPDALDLGREKPSVLVVSVVPPEVFETERFLISWAPSPAPRASFPPGLKKVYIAGQQYLWRWIQMLGPDAVVTDHESLASALSSSVPCAVSLESLPEELEPSLLRSDLELRAARTPIGIAEAVAENYGDELDSISYIGALAMIARARLAELKGEDLTDELLAIAEEAPALKKPSGPALAGHLVFAELGAKERVLEAAKMAVENPGDNEMSDSVFMICPLLASAGSLTDDTQLFDACVKHLERMQELCLREDGLYRHSPLDEAAWGRGNGFPAMGLAWTLSEMPESYAGRQKVLEDFRAHLAALIEHQDASGMWHQVIDHPESYREFTSTCMITFAILRG